MSLRRLIRLNTLLLLLSISTLLAIASSASSASSAGTGQIVGRAFIDVDLNDSYGDADVPLSGLEISAVDGDSWAGDETDEQGNFVLSQLPAGTYAVRLEEDVYCEDVWTYTWLGEWILGWCQIHDYVSRTVVLGEGETVNADIVQPPTGALDGELWIDGRPAPAGTSLAVAVDGEACTSGLVSREVHGAATVGAFEISIPAECAGSTITLSHGGSELYDVTWNDFWRSELDDSLWEVDRQRYRPLQLGVRSDSMRLYGRAFGAVTGVPITAIVDGTVCGQVRAVAPEQDGPSPLPNFGALIISDDQTMPGCGAEGKMVEFCIDGRTANGRTEWRSGIQGWHLEVEPDLCPLAAVPDANCDGTANVADLPTLLHWVAGFSALDACAFRVDSDCDQAIDARDLLVVLRYMSRLIERNPAQDC